METRPCLLVTRPAGQGQALCETLEDMGFVVQQQPLMVLEPLEQLSAQSKQQLLDLDLYRHIIFISANAVRYGLSCIDDYWPQLPVGQAWYAIGTSTAAGLAERGLNPISPGAQMSSEGLLALPELANVAGERVLIVKGDGGRETLKNVLSDRGARVDELACYRRSAPLLEPGQLAAKLADWQVQLILISSGEGLQNMLALLSTEESTNLRNVGLIVPSLRVEKMAREAGFTQVWRTANASDEAFVSFLQQWRSGD
jgi:uroporphyrinogen-III synthase